METSVNNKCKAFTSLEQSKKLAKILPLDSADMCYSNDGTAIKIDANSYLVRKKMWQDIEVIPCWSLAALLGVINKDYYMALYHDGVAWNFDVTHHDNETDKHNTFADTPVDACYEMINKLHEQKIL